MEVGSVRLRWHLFIREFHKEIQRSSRKPAIHWLTWCFPMLLFILLSGNFSEGTLLDMPVAVVDQDNSMLSRELIRKLDAGSHASLVEWPGGLPESLEKLRQVQAYGLLYLPPNFEEDVLAGKQPHVAFYYNALFYAGGLYSTQDFTGLMTSLNSEYRSILATKMAMSLPSLPKLSLAYHSLFNASGSYIYYQQFAATIHLIQLFVVTCTIYVMSRSKSLVHSRSFSSALLGKMAPYTLIYTVMLMAEIALLISLSGARLVGNPFYMFAVGFFYIMAAQSLGLLLFSFTQTSITAYTLTGMLVSIAMTFSGLSVPELSMPLPAQIISELEPLTHALYAMFDLFIRQVPGEPILLVCGILLIYPIMTGLLVGRKLPARLRKQEKMG